MNVCVCYSISTCCLQIKNNSASCILINSHTFALLLSVLSDNNNTQPKTSTAMGKWKFLCVCVCACIYVFCVASGCNNKCSTLFLSLALLISALDVVAIIAVNFLRLALAAFCCRESDFRLLLFVFVIFFLLLLLLLLSLMHFKVPTKPVYS